MTRLIDRHLLGYGREALGVFPVLVIQGARQVGKSTFAHMLVEGRPHAHLTLDDAETLHAAREDPRGFVAQHPQATLVVDEIQRAPDLLLAVKAAVDRERRPGRFVVTGSSDLLALASTPDSLAGRAVGLRLHTLSRGELAGRKEDFAAWARALPAAPQTFTTQWTRGDYIAALAAGGYPEAQSLTPRGRGMWLDSYVERLLGRDIAGVSDRLAGHRAGDVLRLIAANQGGELVKARLANRLSVAATTVDGYLHALSALYLIEELRPWTPNLTSRQVGRRKTAVADSALAMRLAGVKPQAVAAMADAEHLGPLLEAFAAVELLKQRTWSEEDSTVHHFRDRNGAEVDIVLEYADGSVFLLEIKATQTYRPAHAKGIKALAAKLGDRFLGGAVLGLSDRGYLLGDRIYGLPLAVLWEAGS
jgi:predicted AAA+ superfamily ATPase